LRDTSSYPDVPERIFVVGREREAHRGNIVSMDTGMWAISPAMGQMRATFLPRTPS
jgi:hypothetical protein